MNGHGRWCTFMDAHFSKDDYGSSWTSYFDVSHGFVYTVDMTAFLTAPYTGNYTFYGSSDDKMVVYLSTVPDSVDIND